VGAHGLRFGLRRPRLERVSTIDVVSPARRVLVVTTVPLEGPVRERVLEHAGESVELRIVAPAADVSPLRWLASDEDSAREEAEQVAAQSARAVDAAGAEVGDTDPVQAIEDALRTFEADEVVVVIRRGDDASWLEEDAGAEARERFGVPVTQLSVDEG
jgi:hypothetical protein